MASAVAGVQISHVREKDRMAYRTLVESSQPQLQEGSLASQCSHQMREGVTKEFWINQNGRLKGRLTSQRSSLFLFPEKGKIDVIEEMKNVSCLMQETLIDDHKQELRYFEAEKATYNYTTQLLVANEVKFWKYQIDGQDLPDTPPTSPPLMNGIADTMIITITGSSVQMNADHFKATFDPKKE
ncbi:MAG: hypothetical protein KDK55_03955 [Chlamydiia bacterium]|nr:hypothetical protein [Chlamydiia bacterium]